jgi:hypothetical protein
MDLFHISKVLSLCVMTVTFVTLFVPSAIGADAKIGDFVSTVFSEVPNDLTFSKYYEPYEPNIELNAPGYTLPLDLNEIVNLSKINFITDLNSVSNLLQQNGFAVVELQLPWWRMSLGQDMVNPYKLLSDSGIPLFVTSDSMLHFYHMLFDKSLREIEEREFISDITNLTEALNAEALRQYDFYSNDLKEAAKRNIAYLSVAYKLLEPNSQIPVLVADVVTDEIDKINAHTSFGSSDIFIYSEDYSQYIPRGHYTRSEALKCYFKTMMWYGRMAFLLKGSFGGLISEYDAKIQTLQAVLLATSLKNVHAGARTGLEIWDRLYTVTAFYVGFADDLTPYDYLWALDQVFGNDFKVSDLVNEDNLFAFKTELALLPSPMIYGGTGNIVLDGPITEDSLNQMLDMTKGMRLMSQRFIPDSYMFQHLVFPEVGGYIGDPNKLPFTVAGFGSRGYVRGLDVMALLGSSESLNILIDEGDTDYTCYWQQFDELKNEFDSLSLMDWNVNLYWSWLYTLKALLVELPQGYPEFMRTQAWQRHQLHTALASWTQLRHDTILYAKQSYATAGIGPRPAPPPGYIEPLPVFWGRLLSLTKMTEQGLADLNVLSSEELKRLSDLEELLQRMLEIVAKQLDNEYLSSEDHEFIKALPLILDSIITGMDDQDLKTVLVADVHTNAVENLVVEEAGGYVDLIVVACPSPDGSVFLAIGPVFSYYEFKHPMNDRLTDEAWQKLLDSSNRPERPKWYAPLMH